MSQDQEQNTVQTQEAAVDDFASWEAQRNAELAGESVAGEETPAAETADDSETTEQKKEPEGEEPKGEPEGEDPEGEKPKEEGDKPKRKGGFEKRIDKLTRAKAELERQNLELAARVAALEKGKPVEEKPAAATDDPEPKEEDFDNFSDYVKATTKWTYRQEQKAKADSEAEAKANAEAETRKQRAAEGWNERVAEARKQFDDYDEVLEDAADIEVSSELEAALLEAGPAVIYHLAKHREDAERIAKLPTSTALREIGKIEAKLSAAPAKEPTPTPQTKKTTSAPKPPAPLSGQSSALRDLDDPDLPFDEFERRREKQLLRR